MSVNILFVIFVANIFGVHLQNDEVFVSNTLSAKQRFRPNWYSSHGKTYHVVTIFKANFYRAMQYCRQQNMNLISINSQEEQDRVVKFLEDNGILHGHFWTSATSLNGNNEWIWLSTGQQIIYTSWYPGEPSGKHGEKIESCVELGNSKGFLWNDLDCSEEHNFICESIDSECPCRKPASVLNI